MCNPPIPYIKGHQFFLTDFIYFLSILYSFVMSSRFWPNFWNIIVNIIIFVVYIIYVSCWLFNYPITNLTYWPTYPRSTPINYFFNYDICVSFLCTDINKIQNCQHPTYPNSHPWAVCYIVIMAWTFVLSVLPYCRTWCQGIQAVVKIK